MKKYGSKNGSASARQKIVMKMFTMPFCAYWVQILTTSLLSLIEAVAAFRFMFSLMYTTAL